MSKKVLILSGSPRRGGNSDMLCDEFAKGAREAGHDVQKIFVHDKKIGYCSACGLCYTQRTNCVNNDDMPEIIEQMINADVIVMSTPAYFYSMSGQMKVLIDRTITRFLEIRDKDMYFIISAHSENLETLQHVLAGFKGYMACLPGAKEKGVIYGLGVFNAGDIAGSPALEEARKTGTSV